MISRAVFFYSLLLVSCGATSSLSWQGRCTTRELIAFQNQAFLQVDQIESNWVVLVSELDEEHFIRRACLAPTLGEGTVFRFGLPDKGKEIELQHDICALLGQISTMKPDWCLDRQP